jgi:hypothetical protein
MKTLYKVNLWSLVIILPLLASLYFAVFGFLVEGILQIMGIYALATQGKKLGKKIRNQLIVHVCLLLIYVLSFIWIGIYVNVRDIFIGFYFIIFPLVLKLFMIVMLYQYSKLK